MFKLASFFLLTTSSIALASVDLIPLVQVIGPGSIQSDGTYRVPVRVTVRNSGTEIAGRFKVSIEFNHQSFGGTRGTAFTQVGAVDGSFTGDGFYAWTTRALFPGRSLSFEGLMVVPRSVPRRTEITLRVVADSCAGEEFMPPSCRIEESREDNNRTPLRTARIL
jgi:hypothetical protein